MPRSLDGMQGLPSSSPRPGPTNGATCPGSSLIHPMRAQCRYYGQGRIRGAEGCQGRSPSPLANFWSTAMLDVSIPRNPPPSLRSARSVVHTPAGNVGGAAPTFNRVRGTAHQVRSVHCRLGLERFVVVAAKLQEPSVLRANFLADVLRPFLAVPVLALFLSGEPTRRRGVQCV